MPCFSVIVLGLSGLEFKRNKESKVVNHLCAISYVFFLAQLFSKDGCKFVLQHTNISSNVVKNIMGWSSCIVIAIVLRFLEVYINNRVHIITEKDNVL